MLKQSSTLDLPSNIWYARGIQDGVVYSIRQHHRGSTMLSGSPVGVRHFFPGAWPFEILWMARIWPLVCSLRIIVD